MPDIAIVAAAFTGLRNAIEIAKFLKESKPSLEQAEQQLKLADLMLSLTETRIQLADIQTLFIEKDQTIKELEHKLNVKEDFESQYKLVPTPGGDMVYAFNGDPTHYCCQICWDKERNKAILSNNCDVFGYVICNGCKGRCRVGKDQHLNLEQSYAEGGRGPRGWMAY